MTRHELEEAYAHEVEPQALGDFLDWMEKLYAAAAPIIAPMRLDDFKNPGWQSLFDQRASVEECLMELRAIDFDFETLMLEAERCHD